MDRPLYNSRIINSYIALLKKRYPHVSISEVLNYAEMERYQVEDEGHWFTQKQVDRFYECLLKLTGNPSIAREAGRYAASAEAIGAMREYVLSQVGPATAYEMLGKAGANFTRSSICVSKRLRSDTVELTFTPAAGAEERPYQCENRIGYIDAVSLVFKHRLPRIEHPECMFRDGAEVCRYIVSWKDSPSAFWKKVRNIAALGLALGFLTAFKAVSPYALGVALSAGLIGVLIISLYASHLQVREFSNAILSLRDSSDKLIDQINANYNNALFVNEIGQALSKQMEIDGILSNVIQKFQQRLDFDRGMIWLIDSDRTALNFCTGFGYSEELIEILKATSFHVRPESKGVFVVALREQKPFLINDIDEIKDELSPKSLEFARRMKSKAFICCPIIYEDESLGIIAVDNLETKRPLLQSDISLIMGVAQEIAISLHNAALIQSKLEQFRSILHTLAASIDARDPLTAGHSERVTEFAVGICEEMKMPKDFCEMIRVASLLHDYGKIGVRDSVLKKNGRLEPEERQEIEKHADKTRTILEQIRFEGLYRQVPEIAGSHHEKFDGSGYPRGLRGTEIPLGARIIAVADVFEAITAKRHYRDPMPLEKALGIMQEERGIHFDSEVVDAFLRYLDRKRASTETLK
jgi:HD-GYP domain-containing protein (c-di-GMP phosphodiesterase class II)